jgi:choice-of-anchor A domain-containing protein
MTIPPPVTDLDLRLDCGPPPPAEPLGAATAFNIVTLGDQTASNTAVEGRLAVGGNATLTNYGIGSALPAGQEAQDTLVVGGDLHYTNGTVQRGNVAYGGAATLSGVAIPHGDARQDTPLDFAGLGALLRQRSQGWAALAANGTTTVNYWGGPTAQISLSGSDPQLNVFTLAGADLAAANSLQITAPAGSTVLINISGTTSRMQYMGISLSGVDRQHVLYNFAAATQLTLNGVGVQGSILAPDAAITFTNGAIDGTLIGASLSGPGAARHAPFAGTLPPAP